jgi:hypothetical protein
LPKKIKKKQALLDAEAKKVYAAKYGPVMAAKLLGSKIG